MRRLCGFLLVAVAIAGGVCLATSNPNVPGNCVPCDPGPSPAPCPLFEFFVEAYRADGTSLGTYRNPCTACRRVDTYCWVAIRAD